MVNTAKIEMMNPEQMQLALTFFDDLIQNLIDDAAKRETTVQGLDFETLRGIQQSYGATLSYALTKDAMVFTKK